MNLFVVAGTLVVVALATALVFVGWTMMRIFQADKELQERRKSHRH